MQQLQVTKDTVLYVRGIRCIDGGPCQLCETSAKLINWVSNPVYGSFTLCEKCMVRGREL